jgi:diguanylate cyclase (GGDEF)-like protein
MRGQSALEEMIEKLLADPQHKDHPLHDALNLLWESHNDLLLRIQRIARVSDGYQSIARDQQLSLSARFDKQLRQLEKVARISDRYQQMMRDLNIALKEASTHDALTGIGNRRLLTERLREEAERARRYGRPLSVVMLDIDRFKAINDDFGHEIGDRVLIEIARVMEAEVREQDLCGRWGGEEFLILMPETDVATAAQVMERVRASIRTLAVRVNNNLLSVTVSAGVAALHADENYSSTINRADVALLSAKRGGRDRIEISA